MNGWWNYLSTKLLKFAGEVGVGWVRMPTFPSTIKDAACAEVSHDEIIVFDEPASETHEPMGDLSSSLQLTERLVPTAPYIINHSLVRHTNCRLSCRANAASEPKTLAAHTILSSLAATANCSPMA